MILVPLAIPVINPDEAPIVATDVVLLTHVPPLGEPDKVVPVVLPDIHAVAEPVIPGIALTVSIIVCEQPDNV